MHTIPNRLNTELGSSSRRARDSESQNTAPSNLNDFGSAINHGMSVPASMSNSYYPSFSEQADLSVPLIDYQYPLLEQSMDFGYMLAGPTDGPLPDDPRLNEAPLTLPSSFPDSISDALNPAPLGQSSSLQSHPTLTESNAASSQQTTAPSYLASGQTSGHAHTMLPPILHPDSSDSESKYGSDSRSFSKQLNSGNSADADPYAAAFIRDRLGNTKWNIFSARLSERRLGVTSKSGSKTKDTDSSDGDVKSSGANAIDFLAKVEVVKEILRTYVPHPYNPLKSLKHEYARAPTGEVSMTRATVLTLSGWSNTQFSYWARRIEAVSVLASYDDRLRAVSNALEQRLKDDAVPDNNSTSSDVVDESSSDVSASSQLPASGPDYDYVQNVTGKGLDNIIDEVKKRSGASQFLRGKHSSLDPFGTNGTDADRVNHAERSAPIYMPTFQATEYVHTLPPQSSSPQPDSKITKKQRRKYGLKSSSRADHDQKPHSIFDINAPQPHSSTFPHSNQLMTLDHYTTTQPFAPNLYPDLMRGNPYPNTHRDVSIAEIPQINPQHFSHPKNASQNEPANPRRELFPVSDSRSEFENESQYPKRSGDMLEAPVKKRSKQSEI